MKKSICFLICLFALSSVYSGDYPADMELWKSFNSTSGSRIHVNRVFVKPDAKLHTEKKLRKRNPAIEKSNLRFRNRRVVRKQMLDRLYANLVPGEQGVILCEKYDLFHECCYYATLVTQRNMYCVEAYENKEKGVSFAVYPITKSEYDNLCALAGKLKNSHGSCEMSDARDYPVFLSVKKTNGSWETVVCSAVHSVWSQPNEKQKDYFDSVPKVMKLLSEIRLLKNARQVPPVLVKK